VQAKVWDPEQEYEKQLFRNAVGAQRFEPELRGTNVRLGLRNRSYYLNYRSNNYICHRSYKCTFFARTRKSFGTTKQHSAQSKSQGDTGVWCEDDEM